MRKLDRENRQNRDAVFARGRGLTKFLLFVFLLALALRVSAVLLSSSYRVVDYGDDHFSFGWEMGRVARSLAQGNGFSSPLPSPTGPTAIVGPVYPLLLSVIFRLFGIYSTASAIAILMIQSCIASLTCVFLYLGGRDVAGDTAGKLAALLWAMFPLNIFFAATKMWETSISALLAAIFFWYMFSLRESLSPSRWAFAGAFLGVGALLNTSLVMLVIPYALAAIWRHRARIAVPALAASLAFGVVLAPWLIRNHHEFGRFILRSNFPLEFRVCNNEWSAGQKLEDLHPAKAPYLNQRWHDIGEIGFMKEESVLNSRYLAGERGLFAFSVVNRAVNYWTGFWIMPTADFPNSWLVILGTTLTSLLGLLGVRRMLYDKNPAGLMYAGCLLVYPVLYYLTTSQPRFYHAITPLLLVPAACWIVNWGTSLSRAQRSKASS